MKFVTLSFPRSGATFLHYLIKSATKNKLPNTGDLDKIHGFMKSYYKPNQTELLILIIRNYKECIVRHHYKDLSEIDLKESLPEYFWPIVEFDKFSGKKCLIYYKDLISNPKNELIKLSKIMTDIDFSKIINNIDQYTQQSIQHYNTLGSPAQSNGQKTHFHRYKLSPEKRLQWDIEFRKYNPKLFDKYLTNFVYND